MTSLSNNPLYIAVVAAATNSLMQSKTWLKKGVALAHEAHQRGVEAVAQAKLPNGTRK